MGGKELRDRRKTVGNIKSIEEGEGLVVMAEMSGRTAVSDVPISHDQILPHLPHLPHLPLRHTILSPHSPRFGLIFNRTILFVDRFDAGTRDETMKSTLDKLRR